MHRAALLLACLLAAAPLPGCSAAARGPAAAPSVRLVPVGEGWARSSVNAAIFRGSAVVSHGDRQYTAWYDADGRMMLARRTLGTDAWEVLATPYTGNVRDAHNAISLGVDGSGVLHVAWNHHGQPLNYARSVAPGSLELTDPLPATGRREERVTYPQFHSLPGGDLLLVYRDGGSGGGDVLLSRYHLRAGEWGPVRHPLIDGEGERNAYVNPLVVDRSGGWHLSWTWRETPDVATNHDLLYAYSPDGGRSWLDASGRPYALPITAAGARPAREVGQGSTLINQTSMAVDSRGRPMIATYWRPAGAAAPQFLLVWHDGSRWRTSRIGERTLDFRLDGEGTKRIPVSRPLVLAGEGDAVFVVFRDRERGGGITAAVTDDPERARWRFVTLDPRPVGLWEPAHDPVLWAHDRELHLFHQVVGQGDGETLEDLPPQPVSILEWRPR